MCSSISAEVSDPLNRLFAVVYVNGRQWKVSQNDLIALRGSLPIAVGDKIKLEKVSSVEDMRCRMRPSYGSSAVPQNL